jgi:hypothetical protein
MPGADGTNRRKLDYHDSHWELSSSCGIILDEIFSSKITLLQSTRDDKASRQAT